MLIEKILKLEAIGEDTEIELTTEEQREWKREILPRENWYHNSDNPECTFASIYYRLPKRDIKKEEAIEKFFNRFK